MNEYNNESNRCPITPYKATGNLNAVIGNPQVNINDTMNINIQSMTTNSVPIQNLNSTNIVEEPKIPNRNVNVQSNNQSTNNIQSNTQSFNSGNFNATISQINHVEAVNREQQKINSTTTSNNQNDSGVQRTYVTMDNKPKKKKLSLSLGPEFKIGLLIIVILLVFVFFLPIISDFFNGY